MSFIDDVIDSARENDLEHFGVKGMHWGVRRDRSTGAAKPRGAIRRGATKANVALDAGHKVIKEGEKKLIFLPHAHRQKAAARTQSRVLAEAAAINQSAQFKGKDIKNNSRLKNAYFKKVEEAAKKTYAEELGISRTEAWGEVLGVDTKHATNQIRINGLADRITHADGSPDRVTLLELNFVTDELGQIVDISVPDTYLAQSAFDDVDDFLEHFGVKGMKWGVRRDKPSTNAIISARTRVAGRQRQLQSQADKLNLATSEKSRNKEAKTFAKMEADFLKSPDRVTAARMTRGEKYILGFLAVGVPGVGTAAAAGAVAGRTVARKAVERQVNKLNSGK